MTAVRVQQIAHLDIIGTRRADPAGIGHHGDIVLAPQKRPLAAWCNRDAVAAAANRFEPPCVGLRQLIGIGQHPDSGRILTAGCGQLNAIIVIECIPRLRRLRRRPRNAKNHSQGSHAFVRTRASARMVCPGSRFHGNASFCPRGLRQNRNRQFQPESAPAVPILRDVPQGPQNVTSKKPSFSGERQNSTPFRVKKVLIGTALPCMRRT